MSVQDTITAQPQPDDPHSVFSHYYHVARQGPYRVYTPRSGAPLLDMPGLWVPDALFHHLQQKRDPVSHVLAPVRISGGRIYELATGSPLALNYPDPATIPENLLRHAARMLATLSGTPAKRLPPFSSDWIIDGDTKTFARRAVENLDNAIDHVEEHYPGFFERVGLVQPRAGDMEHQKWRPWQKLWDDAENLHGRPSGLLHGNPHPGTIQLSPPAVEQPVRLARCDAASYGDPVYDPFWFLELTPGLTPRQQEVFLEEWCRSRPDLSAAEVRADHEWYERQMRLRRFLTDLARCLDACATGNFPPGVGADDMIDRVHQRLLTASGEWDGEPVIRFAAFRGEVYAAARLRRAREGSRGSTNAAAPAPVPLVDPRTRFADAPGQPFFTPIPESERRWRSGQAAVAQSRAISKTSKGIRRRLLAERRPGDVGLWGALVSPGNTFFDEGEAFARWHGELGRPSHVVVLVSPGDTLEEKLDNGARQAAELASAAPDASFVVLGCAERHTLAERGQVQLTPEVRAALMERVRGVTLDGYGQLPVIWWEPGVSVTWGATRNPPDLAFTAGTRPSSVLRQAERVAPGEVLTAAKLGSVLHRATQAARLREWAEAVAVRGTAEIPALPEPQRAQRALISGVGTDSCPLVITRVGDTDGFAILRTGDEAGRLEKSVNQVRLVDLGELADPRRDLGRTLNDAEHETSTVYIGGVGGNPAARQKALDEVLAAIPEVFGDGVHVDLAGLAPDAEHPWRDLQVRPAPSMRLDPTPVEGIKPFGVSIHGKDMVFNPIMLYEVALRRAEREAMFGTYHANMPLAIPNGTVVIRIPYRQTEEGLSKLDYAPWAEHELMSKVEEKNLRDPAHSIENIPRTIFAHADPPFSVVNFIEGETVAEITVLTSDDFPPLLSEEERNTLDAREQSRLAARRHEDRHHIMAAGPGERVPDHVIDDVVDLIANCATFTAADLPELPATPEQEPGEWPESGDSVGFATKVAIPSVRAAYEAAREKAPALVDLLDQERDLDDLAERAQRLTSRPYVLCHGDLHRGNMIVKGKGKTQFIDWQMAYYGDIASEIGYHLHLMDYSTVDEQKFLTRLKAKLARVNPELLAGLDHDIAFYRDFFKVKSSFTDPVRLELRIGNPELSTSGVLPLVAGLRGVAQHGKQGARRPPVTFSNAEVLERVTEDMTDRRTHPAMQSSSLPLLARLSHPRAGAPTRRLTTSS